MEEEQSLPELLELGRHKRKILALISFCASEFDKLVAKKDGCRWSTDALMRDRIYCSAHMSDCPVFRLGSIINS